MWYQILLHLGLVGLVPPLVVWCFVFFKLNLAGFVSLFEFKFSEFLQWTLGVTDTEELDDTVTLRFKWMSTSQWTSFGLKYLRLWIIWMLLCFNYDKRYFLLKMLFFLDCFNIGLICPFASALFSKSLAFKVKLETEEDDFPSLFDLRNVSWCKIKLILIIVIMLYTWWKCTDCLFCNVSKEIR